MHILSQIDSYSITKKNTIAFCNKSLNDNENQLTYCQLIEMADRLAFFLQNKLKDNKSPIVVYGHKHPYMLVCFLACVKSGRAYCPIDISVPLERVKEIINITDSPIILATEFLNIGLKNILDLYDIKQIINNTGEKIDKSYYVSEDEIFYIIFTSGSTGKPKGVQITENCLYNFVKWAVTLGDINKSENQLTIINQAPFSFDLSVMDLYMSLYLGGTLWCLDKSAQTDSKLLYSSLNNSNANVWVSTPSFANMCLAGDIFNNSLLQRIDLFLFCGETLTNNTVNKLHERFPNSTIINTYGPTESTVAVTEVVITPDLNKEVSPLPVGKPKNGTYIYIIDEKGNELPEGEKGEILIVGDSVSIGYLKNPAVNNRVFSIRNVDGKTYRAYKTGDQGYIKHNQLFYCGRIDLQIKLHGYRIEIEDIENNLLKLPSIKNAVVVPIIKEGNVESLTAFLVVDFIVESALKSSQIIRKELLKFLPIYMIPKKFVFVDCIPMTNNGKVDRKKLTEAYL